MTDAKIVYCNCTYAKVIEDDTKAAVLEALSETGVAFHGVPDLCELAAKKDPQLKTLFADGPVRVAACYERAVKGLCHAAGVDWSDDVTVINMREHSAAEVVQELLGREAAT